MGHFDRGGNRGGGRDRRGGGGFDRRNSNRGGFNRDRGDRPTMHKAVCSSCKANCEVPFKPTGNKPIFCSNCFEKQGGGNRDRSGDRNQRPRFDNKNNNDSNKSHEEIMKNIKTLNYKLDELIKILGSKHKANNNQEVATEKAPKKVSKKKTTKKLGKRKDATPKKVVKKKTPKKKVAAKKPVKQKKK